VTATKDQQATAVATMRQTGELGSPDWEELARRGDERIEALRAGRHPRLFVISGPSGVGKDSVIDLMRQRFPDCFFAVTATTRAPRANEEDGIHYRFLSVEEFERGEREGAFLESANVYGRRYGVLRAPIEDALSEGRDVVVKVDVQGAATIRQRVKHSISIFLAPESMSELLHRLQVRKTEDQAALLRRFETASHELEQARFFDYVVFNEAGKLGRTVDRIHEIVTVERARVRQEPVTFG
jgi:guanylate kinase